MEFENIANLAYNEKKLQEYTTLPEKYAYIKLKDLYFSYRCGDVTLDEAIKQKNEIRKEFVDEVGKYNESVEICKQYHNNKLHNNMLVDEIEKSKDKEKILEKALQAIGIFISDSSFAERNIQKLK